MVANVDPKMGGTDVPVSSDLKMFEESLRRDLLENDKRYEEKFAGMMTMVASMSLKVDRIAAEFNQGKPPNSCSIN